LETKAGSDVKGNPNGDVKFHINGVLVIKALAGETVSSISKRSGLDVTSFMKFNDIPIDARIIPDAYYFVKHKKKRSSQSIYQTKPGDNLWLISQQLGVQLKYLKKYNPGLSDQVLGASTMVRLNKNKSSIPVPLDNDMEVAEVGKEAFAWSIQSEQNKEVKTIPAVAEPVVVSPKPVADKLPLDTLAIAQNSVPDAEKSNIIIYEVKTSDTLYGIARQFGATIKDIMEWNNKSTLTINSGEKLKIIKR
jgi:membrane-bound lytic murein transglycosylase D